MLEVEVEGAGLARFIGLLGEVEAEARRFSGDLTGLTIDAVCPFGGGAAASSLLSPCID